MQIKSNVLFFSYYFFCFIWNIVFCEECQNDETLLSRIFENATGTKYITPRPAGGSVQVFLEIFIQEISAVSDLSNEVEMGIYVNEYWQDPRLEFTQFSSCRENITVGHQGFEKIWSPNAGFINSKLVEIHQSPFKNMYMIISKDGTVRVNYRVKIKAPCVANLRLFPMDNITCTLRYESFSYNVEHVKLSWRKAFGNPVIMLDTIHIAGFTLLSINTDDRNNYYPGGSWDELRLIFEFQRHYSWYIVYIYVPTFIAIFIGWLGISLGVKAMAARAVLCACSFLSLIIIFARMMSVIPPANHLKAIDIWILTLLSFSLITVLELAIVGCWINDDNNRLRGAAKRGFLTESEEDTSLESPAKRSKRKLIITKDSKRKRKDSVYYSCALFTLERMDKFAGYFLPAVFVLFNIIYWSYYAQKSVAHAH